jgi:hypothetical protein
MHYIKFTADASTSEDPPQHFSAGRVYALREDSCARWVNRRVAVLATQAEFDAQQAGAAEVAPQVAPQVQPEVAAEVAPTVAPVAQPEPPAKAPTKPRAKPAPK